ncbi:hypothetical protein E4U59_006222 [Claviceps monticola]|nr:hypothetical protein E4U59_006222 [Claviceps monticola]
MRQQRQLPALSSGVAQIWNLEVIADPLFVLRRLMSELTRNIMGKIERLGGPQGRHIDSAFSLIRNLCRQQSAMKSPQFRLQLELEAVEQLYQVSFE